MADVDIKFEHKGDFGKTFNFLHRAEKYIPGLVGRLNYYGQMGVQALQATTPKDTGLTADSWHYRVNNPSKGIYRLEWYNTNVKDGYANVAILIQYGHATRNGGYVQGIDYINPAMKPIFEKIAANCWREVSGS